MSSIEFSRRQLFRGGLATLVAGKIGVLEAGVRLASAPVLTVRTLSPFSNGSSDRLTQMIVDLMDEDMGPKHMALSAARRILAEAAQPGADAKKVILKYFPDEAVEMPPVSDDPFACRSSIIGSSPSGAIASGHDGDDALISNMGAPELENEDAGYEGIELKPVA